MCMHGRSWLGFGSEAHPDDSFIFFEFGHIITIRAILRQKFVGSMVKKALLVYECITCSSPFSLYSIYFDHNNYN